MFYLLFSILFSWGTVDSVTDTSVQRNFDQEPVHVVYLDPDEDSGEF